MTALRGTGPTVRWWGATGLVAVLCAAVVVALAQKTSPGRPVAAPQLPPPQVGDCVLDPLHYRSEPPNRFGRCGSTRIAEVTAVLPDVDLAGPDVSGNGTNPCAQPGWDYLGLDGSGFLTGVNAAWFGTGWYDFDLLPPTARQRAAGQHWGACVVFPLRDSDPALGPQPLPYQGSLLRQYNGGRPSSVQASCADQLTGTGRARFVACDQPHRLELLATGNQTLWVSTITSGQVRADCREIARRLLARTDPTAGGQLVVTVLDLRIDDQQGATMQLSPPSRTDDTADAACFIGPADPSRMLHGPLVGIGEAALPWG